MSHYYNFRKPCFKFFISSAYSWVTFIPSGLIFFILSIHLHVLSMNKFKTGVFCNSWPILLRELMKETSGRGGITGHYWRERILGRLLVTPSFVCRRNLI
jgi:hypothetical protein